LDGARAAAIAETKSNASKVFDIIVIGRGLFVRAGNT
jgi:hypothetical protein